MFHLIGQAIFGLIVGIIAKLLLPGRDPGGLIMTMLIGVVGSMLGTFVGRAVTKKADYSAHWIVSIIGAVVVLMVYRMIMR